jgi:hypothetical protein
MKKEIAAILATLLLASCNSGHSPGPAASKPIETVPSASGPSLTPAPVDGKLPAKIEAVQLDQHTRELLGAKNAGDLIIRVGVDGTLTVFNAPGQGFKSEPDTKGQARKAAGEIIREFTVRVHKHKSGPQLREVLCVDFGTDGLSLWDPSPPCPI